jgi:glycosidase
MLHFTRAWLAFRKRHPALKDGEIRFIDLGGEVLGFERTRGGEILRLIFNLGEADATLDVGAEWEAAFALDVERPDEQTRLPPGGALALVLAA